MYESCRTCQRALRQRLGIRTHLLLNQLHLLEGTTVMTAQAFLGSVEVERKQVTVMVCATLPLRVEAASAPVTHRVCPVRLIQQ